MARKLPSLPHPRLDVLQRLSGFGAGLLVGSGVILGYQVAFTPPPAPHVATVPTRPTLAPVVVQVTGEVTQPGIYHLRASDRVSDAIAAAGGATDDGAPDAVNLAAHVVDGQRIVVPKIGEALPSARGAGTSTTAARAAKATPPPDSARIDLNVASVDELTALPGIGKTTAEKIVEHRQVTPFQSVQELLDLKLVSSATYSHIQDLITVS